MKYWLITCLLCVGVHISDVNSFELAACLEKGHRTSEDCQCSEECKIELKECMRKHETGKPNIGTACNLESGSCQYRCLKRENALWKGSLGELDKMIAESSFTDVQPEKVPVAKDAPKCANQVTEFERRYQAGLEHGCKSMVGSSGCDNLGVDLMISILELRACIARFHPNLDLP